MNRFIKFALSFVVAAGFVCAGHAADLSRKIEFKKISEQLAQIEDNLKNDRIAIDHIDAQATELYTLSNELADNKRFNEREAKLVQKQLDALGDVGEGETQLKELAVKREELKTELSLFKSRIAETDILQVKIDDLNMQILNFKSQKVIGNLVNKQEVILLPQTFIDSFKALGVFCLDIAQSPIHWYQRLDSDAKAYVLTYIIPVIFIIVAAFWLGLILKRFVIKNWGYKDICFVTFRELRVYGKNHK